MPMYRETSKTIMHAPVNLVTILTFHLTVTEIADTAVIVRFSTGGSSIFVEVHNTMY